MERGVSHAFLGSFLALVSAPLSVSLLTPSDSTTPLPAPLRTRSARASPLRDERKITTILIVPLAMFCDVDIKMLTFDAIVRTVLSFDMHVVSLDQEENLCQALVRQDVRYDRECEQAAADRRERVLGVFVKESRAGLILCNVVTLVGSREIGFVHNCVMRVVALDTIVHRLDRQSLGWLRTIVDLVSDFPPIARSSSQTLPPLARLSRRRHRFSHPHPQPSQTRLRPS